ncbi:hypothetical protein V6N12_050730 [Hibiscus sabdariffa]|uniref:Uncharacterized protein n=1 Tax=Hibiscus sabdariffa TaxID=183260 RepID=A0ABR2GDW1_9ROSI
MMGPTPTNRMLLVFITGFAFLFIFPSLCSLANPYFGALFIRIFPSTIIFRIMEHFQNDDLEYLVDDFYDFDDFEHDDPFAGPEFLRASADFDSVDSDFEDDFESNKLKTDTSAMEARNGKDIQGIPWERLNFTRNKYRETRLKQYINYESIGGSSEGVEKECLQVEKGNTFYAFQFNTRLVKSTIVHFQDAISILFQSLMQVGSNF